MAAYRNVHLALGLTAITVSHAFIISPVLTAYLAHILLDLITLMLYSEQHPVFFTLL